MTETPDDAEGIRGADLADDPPRTDGVPPDLAEKGLRGDGLAEGA